MVQKKKKIIGFDSWVGGSHHYTRLLSSLKNHSVKLTLVHLSSWGNDLEYMSENSIGDMNVRDISLYKNSLLKVLEVERPDAVVLLSTDTFAHRAFMRYCKAQRIPTLHLAHGIESIFGQAGDKSNVPKRSKNAHVRYVFSKLGKLLKFTLPCYIKALFFTNASIKEWFRFISDVVVLAKGGEPACEKASFDAKATKGAVYIPADVDHALNCYGYEEEDVHVVGNPDIIKFGLNREIIGSWKRPKKEKVKYLIYIETGLSSVATMFDGTDGFVKHLIGTSNSLSSQGYRLKVKLKPNQINTSAIIEGIAGTDIEIINDDEFIEELIECSACICETSTLALLPALLGVPILLAKYGALASLSFGSILESYPRNYSLLELENVSNILSSDHFGMNKDALSNWIVTMVGPLPAEKMPDRVVSIINKMIVNGI